MPCVEQCALAHEHCQGPTLEAGARVSRTCMIALQRKARNTTIGIGSGVRVGESGRYVATWAWYGDPIANASIAHPPPFRPSNSPISGGERTGTAHDFQMSTYVQ